MILLDVVSQNNGWTVVIIGLGVVFGAMYFLSLLFNVIPKIMMFIYKYQQKKKGEPETASPKTFDVDVDTNAAISMALFLYLSEMHDEESNILTIKRLSRRYSPWSSKIYSVMNYPNKK
ncbi:MAG TPA: OadG family protein [Salinivirgaceae bacterium]|nr:OadG family protein [Salinivirgaceae bacterium]